MTTIDTDVFLQKVASDVGALAAGGTSPAHIVPHMPGMGIISSLKKAADVAEKEMLGAGRVISIDRLMDNDIVMGGSGLLATVGNGVDELTDVGIIVIDCSDSHSDTDQQVKFLNDFLPTLEGKASVWLVTQAAQEFEKGLKVNSDVLSFRYKSRMSSDMGDGVPTIESIGHKPKP